MVSQKSFIVQVAPAKPAEGDSPATGPTYRAAIAPKEAPTLEGVTTCYESFTQSAEKYASNNCLGWREGDGPYKWLTYGQTKEQVDAVGSAMASLGMGAHSRAGVYGANSPQWMVAMQACNRQTIYCVPLYDTLGPDAVEYIVWHSETSLVFSQSEKLGGLLLALNKDRLKGQVKTVVYWGKGDASAVESIKALGITVYSFEEFLELGRKTPSPPVKPKPEDLCTIMYTSGTTGDPKGVELTHSAAVAVVASVKAFLESVDGMALGPSDVFLSFLPLAHIFDRASEEMYLHLGASIGYWRGDIKLLVDDIAALRPTIFCGVPRVFDRIYAGVMAQVDKGGFLKKTLFHWGYGRKVSRLSGGAKFDQATPLFDAIVFSKVKARLGGRVRIIVSGGAPLARHVEDFLRVCMCCRVVQGYGLTETCAASFIAVPDVVDHFGTVGPPQPCQEFRLEAVPEMNYDPNATPPRGEVVVRGPNVFSGYYKEEGKTKEVLEADGWFHTGDIGELTPTGALRIIDRKKNIFKLSQGEYIAVEKVEAVYKQCGLVEQIWVYGNSFESSLVAVVVPIADKIKALASQNGQKDEDVTQLCRSAKIKEAVLADLTATAKAGKLKGFEMVKAIYLETELFCVNNDLLTPTFKLKRPQLQKKYQPEIDAMYAALKAA